MSSARPDEHGIPSEIKENIASFDTHLSELEAELKPLLSINRNELTDKLEPIDAAKVDLVAAYAINSLFWMYMNVCGLNPKEHAVKQELTRIQSYMQRVKEIEDKKKAPKLNKDVSKRFVKSALWQAAQKREISANTEPSTSQQSVKEGSGGKKQRRK
ncbi:nuclear nucleic acid-binding protein C1D-like [Physella acuta]|uniref:nuclear nucleic acid-binding protein C1D-like n=1 Tax=Physella acuta TaxID=109671 RepID=UPI0027DEA0EE|nr:nuclear nucleic acid-binding protein C1D-like [Physella acuta]